MNHPKQDGFYYSPAIKTIHNDKGAVALILVVWVVVVLMAIVGEFAYSMRTEINIVRNFKEEEESYQLAIAGIEQAKLEMLLVKESDVIFLDEDGKLVFKDSGEEEEKTVRNDSLGRGSFEYTITDEDSKLNINTASLNQLKIFLELAGVDSMEVDTIADSIFDWRDTNELFLLNGAEEDYYRSLENPYSCKDGLFDVIEELLLVKGMTPEILYGSKGEGEEESFEGIVQYLTVHDTGKLNINTASSVVLESLLGIQEAENIMMQRDSEPIRRPQSNGKVSSSYFTIVSTGNNSDGSIKRTIKAIIRKHNAGLETVYWHDNII